MNAKERSAAEWDLEAISLAIQDTKEELKDCISGYQEEILLAEIEKLENQKNLILLAL